MEQVINDYISDELVYDRAVLPLHDDTPLVSSNILDSVAMLNLVMFLEDQFGVSIPVADLKPANLETINAICAYIRSRTAGSERQPTGL